MFAPTLRAAAALTAACAFGAGVGEAGEFRSTADLTAILYDAPSAKAKPLFVLGHDTPLEVVVTLEGWVKVRDATGSIGWVEKRTLSDKRMLVVRTPMAEVLANPDASAALVFRAEQNVLLELAESATSSGTTATPGWVKIRHRDGQVGYVRIAQIFGL